VRPITSAIASSLLVSPSLVFGQAQEKADAPRQQTDKSAGPRSPTDEPELVITPNTIRIQPIDSPKDGHWVIMPGFSELGSPSFSKDGQWVAFDAYKTGYNNSPPECWIVRYDEEKPTRLAIGATPRWSPDGKRLLFMRDEANDPRREPGVFLINRDGTGELRIRDGRWPDWSPDGKEIVFSAGGEPGGGLRSGATICIAEADGTGRREITLGDCPSWSPDGRKIAFCYSMPGQPPLIRVFDLRKNEETTMGIGWFRANWMPDSESLVANGVVGRELCMVRLPVSGSRRPTKLATDYEGPFSPCCSSDGKSIVFIARRPRNESR